jgi:hypothetical protein
MTNTSFKVYSDPGHGWIAVKLKVLSELGLSHSDFTCYSYRKGKTIYLEEDCDASKFISTWVKKFGVKPNFIEKYTNKRSPIRSYPNNWS